MRTAVNVINSIIFVAVVYTMTIGPMEQVQDFMIDLRDNHKVLGHVFEVLMHALYVWLMLKGIIPGWEGPSRRPYMRGSGSAGDTRARRPPEAYPWPLKPLVTA